MKSLFTRAILLALMALALASAVLFSTLVLAEGVPPAQATPTPAVEHCISGPDKPTLCFKTQAEALYATSGGRIRLRAEETVLSLSGVELAAAGIYALVYEHPNLQGASLALYSGSCSGWNNFSQDWNDRVSSAWVADGCGLTLYEHYNLTGSPLHINPWGTYYVGDWFNDKASSWKLP